MKLVVRFIIKKIKDFIIVGVKYMVYNFGFFILCWNSFSTRTKAATTISFGTLVEQECKMKYGLCTVEEIESNYFIWQHLFFLKHESSLISPSSLTSIQVKISKIILHSTRIGLGATEAPIVTDEVLPGCLMNQMPIRLTKILVNCVICWLQFHSRMASFGRLLWMLTIEEGSVSLTKTMSSCNQRYSMM